MADEIVEETAADINLDEETVMEISQNVMPEMLSGQSSDDLFEEYVNEVMFQQLGVSDILQQSEIADGEGGNATGNGINFREEKEYEEVSFEPVIFMDFYHYLNYILNNDKRSLLEIINRPERNLIGNAYLNVSFEDQIKKHKGTRRGEKEELFLKHINNLKHLNPSGFVLYLENVCGYKEFIVSETGKESKEKVYEILDNVNKLAFICISVRELFEKIKERINEFPKKKRKLNLKNFSVMTFHASKGLEFDAVFLPDVNEGKVPGRMTVNSKAIEEERRLFYVAVTRAKEKLFVLAIKNEESESVLPSRFIEEMEENVLLKENV